MTLKLVTPPAELLTLAQSKLHLRVDHADDDTLITALISTAREECEHTINRGIGSQTWKVTLDGFPDSGIRLGMPPVASISSIAYIDSAGDAQTLDGAAYTLDNASDLEAWALPAEGYEWPDTRDTANAVIVTFVCGLTTLPATLKAWMLLRIGTLYQHRAEIAAGLSVAPLPGEFSGRLLDRWRVLEY